MAQLHELAAVVTMNATKFTRGVNRIIQNSHQMRAAWGQAGRDINAAVNRVGIAAGIIGGVVVKQFSDFEQQITRVGAVTETLGTEQFQTLKQAALDAGTSTRFTATQAAQAIEKLGLAGLSTAEITGGALKGSLQLATAAQISISEAADIAAKQMRAFGLEAGQLGRINDTLVATQARANTNIRQLSEALKPVAPLAAQNNVSLERTAAILAKMADAGFQGSIAGIALRRAFINLASPANKAKKILQEFGVQAADPFIVKLQKIERGLNAAANETEKTRKAAEIFGARAAAPLLAVFDQGTAAINKFTKGLQEAGGIAQRIEQKQLDTLAGQLAILRSIMERTFIDIGSQAAPIMRNLIGELQLFIKANRPKIVERFSSALQRLIDIVFNVTKFLRKNSEQLFKVADAFGSVTAQVLKLLAEHPRLAAFLALLKAGNLTGINQAIFSIGVALKETIVVVKSTTVAVGGLRTALLGLTGGAVLAGFTMMISKIQQFSNELREARRAAGEAVAAEAQGQRARIRALSEREKKEKAIKEEAIRLSKQRDKLNEKLKEAQQRFEKIKQQNEEMTTAGFVGGLFTGGSLAAAKQQSKAKADVIGARRAIEQNKEAMNKLRDMINKIQAAPPPKPEPIPKPPKTSQDRGAAALFGFADDLAQGLNEGVQRARQAFETGKAKVMEFAKSLDVATQKTNERTQAEIDAMKHEIVMARMRGKELTAEQQAFLRQQIQSRRQRAITERVNSAFTNMVDAAAGVNKGFGKMQRGMRQMADRMDQFRQSIDPQQLRQAGKHLSQSLQALGTQQGLVASLIMQRDQLQAAIRAVDTFSRQQELMKRLEKVMQRLADALEPPEPAFTGPSPLQSFFKDPGLQSDQSDDGGGNVTVNISTHSLTKPSPDDFRQLMRMIQQELHRMGRRV